MRWYEKEFDRETAEQFITELHRFTEEFVLNYAPEIMAAWPLTNILPDTIFRFNPRGAIVHTTDTTSLWNALHLTTKHVFGTHFMIASGRHSNKSTMSRYPLLSEVPADIMMLYPLDALVPHSGFVSPFTWGIELRNAGRLRPYPKMLKPLPLMPVDETDKSFAMQPNERYDAYWRNNLWCDKFEGPTFQWEDFLYELPTIGQVISLVVLLRVLDCLNNGLDRRLVLPSNCISGSIPKLPLIAWDMIRDESSKRTIINTEHEWLNFFSPGPFGFEMHDIDDEDESMHGEQMDSSRWRGERDDGQLTAMRAARQFKLASGYTKVLEPLGFDRSDPNFALHMWAISKGFAISRDEVIYSHANAEFFSPHIG